VQGFFKAKGRSTFGRLCGGGKTMYVDGSYRRGRIVPGGVKQRGFEGLG